MNYEAKSLTDLVETYLKDQILGARLHSGVKLVEKDIAERLNISRAPVREALRSLSQQGLVTFSPRRGHFILEMPRDEIFEVFQIRITLELQILRILISNRMLKETDYDHLNELSCQMKRADEQAHELGQVYLLNSLDIDFHRYLWATSKSVRRARLLEGLFFQLLIVMNENIESLGSCNEKAEEHLRLIQALKQNNVALVCDELRRHLDKYIVAALGELSEEERSVLDTIFELQ